MVRKFTWLNPIKSLAKILKLVGCICCITAFLFWSHKAISKFISAPISSHVSYKNGDDNMGNISFPAITICLKSFGFMAAKANKDFVKHCSRKSFNFYERIYFYCYKLREENELLDQSSNKNEDYSYYFPEWIEATEKPEVIEYFHSIEEAMNASHIKIHDFLYEYSFGDVIGVQNSGYTYGSKIQQLNEDWLESVDYSVGTCYTFDPSFLHHSMVQQIQLRKRELMYMQMHLSFLTFSEYKKNPSYIIKIHENLYDRFDATLNFPLIEIAMNQSVLVKLKKTNVSSLAREDFGCSNEPNYGPERCRHLKAGNEFIQLYKCRLPWMNHYEFGEIVPFCIGSEHEENDLPLIIKSWQNLLQNATIDCPAKPKCKKSIYDVSFEPFQEGHGTSKSKLKIQLASTKVVFIEDSHDYDLQSLIGEVGGTLGLLLGLSFFSLFELIDYLATSLN